MIMGFFVNLIILAVVLVWATRVESSVNELKKATKEIQDQLNESKKEKN